MWILALGIVAPHSATAQSFRDGVVGRMSFHFPPDGMVLTGDDLIWAHTFHTPVISGSHAPPFLRLQLSDITLPVGSAFRIEISDASGKLIETLDRTLLSVDAPLWTLAVPGNSVGVAVYGPDARQGFAFTVSGIAFGLASKALESIYGESDLIDVSSYDGPLNEVLLNVHSSVAKLFTTHEGASVKCTGFRIGIDRVLTSGHCVSDVSKCRGTAIMFGYEKAGFGGIQVGQQVRCVAVIALAGEADEDIAILQVAPALADDWSVVSLSGQSPVDGEQLFIVQHPGGEPKKLSAVDCRLLENNATRADPYAFGHSCDTKGGSSGAPIFNAAGLVVGQQRAGYQSENVTDQPNKGTHGTVLTEWVAAQLAEVGNPPLGTESDADPYPETTVTIPTDAVPLPLPVAPDDVATGDEVQNSSQPEVQSDGSTGATDFAPDL